MADVNHPLDDGLPIGGPASAVSSWAELEGLADGPLPSLRNLFEGAATRGARGAADTGRGVGAPV